MVEKVYIERDWKYVLKEFKEPMIKHRLFLEEFEPGDYLLEMDYLIDADSSLSGYKDDEWKNFLEYLTIQRAIVIYLENNGFSLEVDDSGEESIYFNIII